MDNLVWAKMRGYLPWPGRISTPKPIVMTVPPRPKQSQWIFFFGTKNYSWIEESNIKPYVEYREMFTKKLNRKSIKHAVRQMEDFLRDPQKYRENAELPFDTVEIPEPQPKIKIEIKIEPKSEDSSDEVKVPIVSTVTTAKKSRPRKKKTSVSFRKKKAKSKTKRTLDNHGGDDETPNAKRIQKETQN